MWIPPGILAGLFAGFGKTEILARWTGRVVALKFRGLHYAGRLNPAQFLQIAAIDYERMEAACNCLIRDTHQIFSSQFFNFVGAYSPSFLPSYFFLKLSGSV